MEENNFKFRGTVTTILEPKKGVSANGEWVSQQFVVRNDSLTYNKDVVFDIFGQEKIEKFDLHVGDDVTVLFNLSTNSHNGKYYLSAKVWGCNKYEKQAEKPQSKTEAVRHEEADDDLPF